jgi:hypothetical protein
MNIKNNKYCVRNINNQEKYYKQAVSFYKELTSIKNTYWYKISAFFGLITS